MTNFVLTLSIILIALVFLAAFFSASETGMMAINRYRLRHLARQGHKTPQLVQHLLERPDRLLGIILIGSTCATIFISSLVTLLVLHLWGNDSIIYADIVLTFIILIFAEMTPKILAANFSMQIAFVVAWPLWVLLKILYPTVWFSNLIANSTLQLFGVHTKNSHLAEKLNTEELRTVLNESVTHEEEENNELLFQNKDMLLGILDLSRMKIEDVMVPRAEIVGININDPIDEIIKLLSQSIHSRLPVFRGTTEHIIGILHIKDAFKLLCKANLSHKQILKMLRVPYFVPEGTTLQQQIHEFRLNRRHLALVVDEYGDLQGLVTLEDIMEEIVGQMSNSFTEMKNAIKIQVDQSVIVDGSISIRDLNRFLRWHLPTQGPKTVSGLIIEHLENIPTPHISIEINGYVLEVLEIKENRVDKARVSLYERKEE